MRAAFTAVILCLSAFYTYWAFTDLNFLSQMGRLGPGFFPRIIGIGLVLACLVDLAVELRRRSDPPLASEYVGTVVLLVVLTGLFVLGLNVVGGIAAMIAFLLVTLTVLNRGRLIQNLAIAILLPTAIYFLFDVWLNASIPRGMIFERWFT
jgi:putative tricarboxylic transport membrane protein